MSNTATTKTALQSTNFWTGIATIVAALFSYFAISPDLDGAAVLADGAQQAVTAISTKNYIALFGVVVNVGNILYHLFKK